jgi:hypothetical protein
LGIGDCKPTSELCRISSPGTLWNGLSTSSPTLRPFLCAVAIALRLTMARACNELALRHQFQAAPGFLKALKEDFSGDGAVVSYLNNKRR